MPPVSDQHWSGLALPPSLPRPAVNSTAHYVKMRDGISIALTLHLPADVGSQNTKLPTIIRQTRYLREIAAANKWSKKLGIPSLFDIHRLFRNRFLAQGYAWVDVDVRGTGASGGTWLTPWYTDQIQDSAEIIDWIIAHPWSNKRVGSLGISYDGTCADMLPVSKHPAVRAVAPLFSLYDVYSDIAFPGGVPLSWFTNSWGAYNQLLDTNRFAEASCWPVRVMAEAAAELPEPKGPERFLAALGKLDRSTFEALVVPVFRSVTAGVVGISGYQQSLPASVYFAERVNNLDVGAMASRVIHRDDDKLDPREPNLTIDIFSPHSYRKEQESNGAAFYSVSGWRDGAYAHSAIKRYLNVSNAGSRLTIGPWNHTGLLRIHSFQTAKPTEFDHAGELIAFFDSHLKENTPSQTDNPVRYFTTGKEIWQQSRQWPPPGVESSPLYLGPNAKLLPTPPTSVAEYRQKVDDSIGTGRRSRWRSLLSVIAGDYPDRAERDRKLFYLESPPLAADLECTGHPLVTLWVSWSSGSDAQLFAYLEEVDTKGRAQYLSEGQLRARFARKPGDQLYKTPGIARSYTNESAQLVESDKPIEMCFDLLPLSHVFSKHNKIRLVITSADKDHFAAPPNTGATMTLLCGNEFPSRIELPVTSLLRWLVP